MTSLSWPPPAAPLRAQVLRTSAVALLVLALAAMAARAWLQLGALYPVKAAAMFVVAMSLTFGHIGPHHPYPRFGPANIVTTFRVVMLALIAGLIGEAHSPRIALTAATIAVVMTVLDGVDGWLARRTSLASGFGARFDMETDAALVLAMSILVWQYGKAGAWAVLGGMMRYVFLLAVWWLPWMARPLSPTYRAKAITVIYVVGLTLALMPGVTPPLSATIMAAITAALTWSFAVDVRRLWRMS